MIKHIAVITLIVASFITGSAVGEGVCATEQCSNASKIPGLPLDVLSFVNRRDGCDHFRGEPTDFDEAYLNQAGEDGLREQRERAEFINQNIAELCTGTDAQLRALKVRYDAADSSIIKLLNTYEPTIENK